MRKGFFKNFGFSGESNPLGDLGTKLNSSLYIVMTVVGTVLLGFGSAYASGFQISQEWSTATTFGEHASVIFRYPVVWMIAGTLLSVVGGIGNYLDSNALRSTIDTLKTQNNSIPSLNSEINGYQETIESLKSSLRLLHTELVTTHPKAAYKSLGLTTNERISIYYEHDSDFYLLARHSKNPVFAKSHRQKFALNQGVIGQAWQHQKHVESHCPAFQNRAEYLVYMGKTYGFKDSQTLGFAMKSCRYVAIAISDADSHTGVIVFESTSEDFLNAPDKCIESEIVAYCSEYQGMHSKFLRDGLELNREAHIKSAPDSVEKDFLKDFKKGGAK